MYPSTTHVTPESDIERVFFISAIATFTTVTSRVAMRKPSASTISTDMPVDDVDSCIDPLFFITIALSLA
ncbi:hypothetical protein ACFWCU_03480 [Bacillus subtilis]